MYHDELARSGRQLFRIRGELMYMAFIGGLIVAWCRGSTQLIGVDLWDSLYTGFGLMVTFAGTFLRLAVAGQAPSGSVPKERKQAEADTLNTTGFYSIVRNPLYVGRILIFSGIALLSGSWVYGVLVFLVSVLVYERISFYEEDFLKQKFGAPYADWAGRVPSLLPRLTGWVTSTTRFSLLRAIWRDSHKLLILFVTLAGYHVIDMGGDVTVLLTPSIWSGALLISLLLRLAVATLLHFTSVFDHMTP